jgi:hypothetical protein
MLQKNTPNGNYNIQMSFKRVPNGKKIRWIIEVSGRILDVALEYFSPSSPLWVPTQTAQSAFACLLDVSAPPCGEQVHSSYEGFIQQK